MQNKNFKILIDENLSRKLLSCLTIFPESNHVSAFALENTYDIDIWKFAKAEGYTILTRDIDFYGLSALYGCPPKVIHLLTPKTHQSTAYFRERLTRSSLAIIEFLKSEIHCYLKIE